MLEKWKKLTWHMLEKWKKLTWHMLEKWKKLTWHMLEKWKKLTWHMLEKWKNKQTQQRHWNSLSHKITAALAEAKFETAAARGPCQTLLTFWSGRAICIYIYTSNDWLKVFNSWFLFFLGLMVVSPASQNVGNFTLQCPFFKYCF